VGDTLPVFVNGFFSVFGFVLRFDVETVELELFLTVLEICVLEDAGFVLVAGCFFTPPETIWFVSCLP
jgi:hypothetical protein